MAASSPKMFSSWLQRIFFFFYIYLYVIYHVFSLLHLASNCPFTRALPHRTRSWFLLVTTLDVLMPVTMQALLMNFLYAKCVFEHIVMDRTIGHVPTSVAARECLETSLIKARFTAAHGMQRLCSVPVVISLPAFELNAVASCKNKQAPSPPRFKQGSSAQK